MEELKWIVSDGGPSILISAERKPEWDGGRPWRQGKPIVAVARRYGDPSVPPSDYERACDVKAYAGPILVVPGENVVVLGFDVCPTTVVLSDSRTAFVVRAQSVNDQDEESIWNSTAAMSQTLASIPREAWSGETQSLILKSGRFSVMDSGEPGDSAPENLIVDSELDPGVYTVSTCEYEPDEETRLILHRLYLT